MNEKIKEIYFAIRKLVPDWPAHKAYAQAKESANIAIKYLWRDS